MPPEFGNFERLQSSEKTETSLESGLVRLKSIAEKKYTEKDGMVLIVITGEPNAGKSELRNRFQSELGKRESIKPEITSVVGLQKVESLQKYPKKFLLVEEASSIEYVKTIAANKGLSPDLFVYIYNPNLVEHISNSSIKSADLIIINPDSVKK